VVSQNISPACHTNPIQFFLHTGNEAWAAFAAIIFKWIEAATDALHKIALIVGSFCGLRCCGCEQASKLVQDPPHPTLSPGGGRRVEQGPHLPAGTAGCRQREGRRAPLRVPSTRIDPCDSPWDVPNAWPAALVAAWRAERRRTGVSAARACRPSSSASHGSSMGTEVAAVPAPDAPVLATPRPSRAVLSHAQAAVQRTATAACCASKQATVRD
jgi:hypothetical protein